MQLPLYRFLELTACQAGLGPLVTDYHREICLFFSALTLLCCFLGFGISRPMLSALTAAAVIYAGCRWLSPAWGPIKGVTFCAIGSVSMAVITFLASGFSAMALCGAIAAGFVWQLLQGAPLPPWAPVLLMALSAAAAAGFTHFFPVLSLCSFTALWGSMGFLSEGLGILMPAFQISGTVFRILLTAILFSAGLTFQLWIFRKQQRFQETIPTGLKEALEKRKRGRKALA